MKAVLLYLQFTTTNLLNEELSQTMYEIYSNVSNLKCITVFF